MEKFKLSENFVSKYKRKKAPFGFNGLGELVYMRTYSRIKDDGKNERWWETVQRVVEGTYSMQKNHIDNYQLGWNAWQAQKFARQDPQKRGRNSAQDTHPQCIAAAAGGTTTVRGRGAAAAERDRHFVAQVSLATELTARDFEAVLAGWGGWVER